MDLSICLVSWNTRNVLEQTVAAATADAARLDAEIIVVDNGSRDGSVRMLQTVYPAVMVIGNQHNRFFTAALNQALAVASGSLILVLNSDAVLTPGTLPELAAFLRDHRGVGAVSPRMYFPDGRLQLNCARFPTFGFLLLEHTFLGRILTGARDRARCWRWYAEWDRLSERSVDVAPGSCLLIRREAIRLVGAFDERFRLYFSDDDWCRRLMDRGGRIAYVPQGGVVHPEGSSTRPIQRLAQHIFLDDMLAYAGKHFGPWHARVLRVLSWPTRWALGGRPRDS